MHIFMNNCFHWAGFHMINHFLEKGYTVDGFYNGNEKTKEHFMMFLGRNNNFSLLNKTAPTEMPEIQYDLAISVGKWNEPIKCKKYVEIEMQGYHLTEKDKYSSTSNETTIVYAPLLFGEWMPMTEKGIYQNETFMRFDSEFFLKEAVYISRFIESLIQLLQSSRLSPFIKINSMERQSSVGLEHSIYLYNNKPEEYIGSVVNHYQTYSDIYKELYHWTK